MNSDQNYYVKGSRLHCNGCRIKVKLWGKGGISEIKNNELETNSKNKTTETFIEGYMHLRRITN